jgi:hypothetical protein
MGNAGQALVQGDLFGCYR